MRGISWAMIRRACVSFRHTRLDGLKLHLWTFGECGLSFVTSLGIFSAIKEKQTDNNKKTK